MKLSEKITYPYPIWGWQNNYTVADADCEVKRVYDDPSSFSYEIEVKSHDEVIDQLLEDGKAAYACVATCSATFYNRFFNAGKQTTFRVDIPCDEVCRQVKLKFIVVAMSEIPNYRNDNLNVFYEGQAYIPKGGVLSLLAEGEFEATPCGGKSVGDIIKVVENTWSQKIEYQTDNNKIRIALPTDQHSIFDVHGSEFSHVLHSTIVYRAVLTAIGELPNVYERDYEWVIFLKHEIEEMEDIPNVEDLEQEKGYTIDEASTIADRLLHDPFVSAFEDLRLAENRK